MMSLAALAVAGTLALAGCSADPDERQSRPGSTAGPSAGVVLDGEGELFEVNATAREDMEPGGVLRRAVGELPDQWNPLHTAGSHPSFNEVRGPLSVTNWDFDGEGVPSPNENYLAGVEEEVTDGRQVVTLHLNPEAVWNGGEPITWEDYAATVAACSGSAEFQCANPAAFSQVESVAQGETEFDVVVTFAAVFPDWEAMLSTVLPAEGVQDAETFNAGWAEYPAEWFTGPFAVEEIDEAQQAITLVPNENWWGPEPMLDAIEMRALRAEATATAFQNGELDVFEVGADPNAYQLARAVPGAEVRQAAGTDWRHLTFNTTAGALAEPEVRRAIVRAVDREAIAASSLAGLPEELHMVLDNHVFMRGQEGYEDNAGDYAYDPARAAADLDAAGWELDEATGIRERDGEPLTVRFTVFSGVPVSENEALLVQAQLREVGVDVELDHVAEAAFTETLGAGAFEMIAFSWYGSPFPLQGLAAVYGDPEMAPLNYARLDNPELNALIEQIATEPDQEERLRLADRADELIWASAHTLPLYQRPQLVATTAELANFGATGLSSTRPENWGFAAAG
ncbi:ABC transporter family substrate-binding protein [Georgenia sp. AZ-5]|uniref:ABC transporter family substrate-binding protein n=1 Tax=Georgenia sp. AZ-5 TaxID=3367526 RepID=UPI003754BC09